MQRHRCYVLLVIVLILICGCFYIPASLHDISPTTEEDMEFLIPGETTRADVVFKFGDPMQRIEKDRYYIYHWKWVEGYWFFLYEGQQSVRVTILCIEFAPDGLLKRWKEFEGGVVFNQPEKKAIEWLNDESNK